MFAGWSAAVALRTTTPATLTLLRFVPAAVLVALLAHSRGQLRGLRGESGGDGRRLRVGGHRLHHSHAAVGRQPPPQVTSVSSVPFPPRVNSRTYGISQSCVASALPTKAIRRS